MELEARNVLYDTKYLPTQHQMTHKSQKEPPKYELEPPLNKLRFSRQ
jgi:hypothetical protein